MTDLALRLATAINTVGSAAHEKHISTETETNLKQWLTSEGCSAYHEELVSLVEKGEWEQLTNAFWEVIPFGTGGRRGTMGNFGTATINARTIAESADGLARYLKQTQGESDADPIGRAVVTHDTRNRSREFAELTATTLAAHGLKVFLFESYRSTPELSFAVRHLNCNVGVMISASHNPPADNGFKAYWDNGGQVLPPHDTGIIDCVMSADQIPEMDLQAGIDSGRIEIVGEAIDDAFINAVASLSLSNRRDVSAVFTPLHGVGETCVWDTLKAAKFDQIHIYEPQRKPDGNFPNVADHFPNPERDAVFGPAIEHAQEVGADLVLASDPDADRLGVVARDQNGEYVRLSGNQVGALLTDHVLRNTSGITSDHYVVETLVTTPLIGAIARSHGATVIDDLLVGFKYIGQTMDQRGAETFLFGAEESLGYLSGGYARDKDASIAGLYIMELAADLKAEGKTLHDRLNELFAEHGYHAEGQTSEVCPGPTGREQIVGLMAAFRSTPPAELAGLQFAKVNDYQMHEVRSVPGNEKLSDLPEPSGNLLFLHTAEGVTPSMSIAVRPSGTEPKIRFYFFTSAQTDTATLEQTRSATDEKMKDVQNALSGWLCETLESM